VRSNRPSTIAGSIAWLNMPGPVFVGGEIMARNRKGRPRKTAEQKLRVAEMRQIMAIAFRLEG
jgi:hypothetical protein